MTWTSTSCAAGSSRSQIESPARVLEGVLTPGLRLRVLAEQVRRAAREQSGEQYRHRRSHDRQIQKPSPQRGHRRLTRSKARPAPQDPWTFRPKRATQERRVARRFCRSVHWKGSGTTPGLSLWRHRYPTLYASPRWTPKTGQLWTPPIRPALGRCRRCVPASRASGLRPSLRAH